MPAQTPLIRQNTARQLPAVVNAAPPSLWLDSIGLAELAGISRQASFAALTKCANGKPWRGVLLEVRTADNGAGLECHAPSLPRPLLDIWMARNPGILESPQVPALQLPLPTVFDSGIGARTAVMRWKMSIIAPALAFPKGSRHRSDALKQIAGREHKTLNGTPVTFSVDTLRDWCATVTQKGDHGLAGQRRADAGQRRNFVCRDWDKACPLPETEKAAIADAIDQHLRSLWRSGASENKIKSLATTKLQELSQVAGWNDAPQIDVGLYAVRKWKEYRKLAIKETDAKKYHDLYTPRIHRSRDGLQPMDIIIGDVHPDDHLMPDDGIHQTTHRMISWFDMATNDFFITLKLYPKGKGVTQADVAASFVDMVQAWGLPRTLYLDNGSEYKWDGMIAGFETLQGLQEQFRFFVLSASEIDAIIEGDGNVSEPAAAPRAIVKAGAYRPQSKSIEPGFCCLEKFKAMLPGYIGGNRMVKKTHNVGKAPKPYPGTPEHYRDTAFPEILAWYRNEPQGGMMANTSPNQRKRDAIASGWQPARADRSVLLYALAERRRCKVHNKGIEISGKWYQSGDIVKEIGSYIEVSYAKWSIDQVLWIDDNGKAILIPLAENFHPLDVAGAKHQSMLAGIGARYLSDLAKTAPRINALSEITRHNAAMPPAPETPAGTPIILDGESRRIVDAIDEAQAARQSVTPLPDAAPFDLYALPPPKKEKPDASADAPGFNIYDLLKDAPKPPRKEATWES